jgi:hypothetical protein
MLDRHVMARIIVVMASSKAWRVAGPHTIRLQHKTHRGWVKITVDGEVAYEQTGSLALWDTGFDREFTAFGSSIRVRIEFWPDLRRPVYFLWVDGQIQADLSN